METKKIVMGVISVAVAIIVLMSMIPIFTDAGASEDTFTNEGYFRMTHFDDTGEHTISWSYTKPSVITVDGEDVTVSYVQNANITVLADTNFLLRYYTGAEGQGRAIAYIPSTGNRIDALSDANGTVNLTLSEGTMTGTINTTSVSSTYEDIYVPSNEGEYVMKYADKPAYLSGESEIFGFGLTSLNTASGTQATPGTGFRFEGTIDDGVTASVWRGSNTTVSDTSINNTEVNGYVGLYQFDSITATATLTETVDSESVQTTTDLTYNYVIVPYEVTAERSVHASPVESTLIGLIPLLMMVGILLTAIGLFIAKYRKN